ncbi:MAG: hypothetical protein AAF696_03770 [Bacteroidota bacterium]
MNNQKLKNVINTTAVLTILSGAMGMLFSFAFLWSGRMEDIVGAGFVFLSRAVLFGTALITLGIMYRKDE